VIPGRSATLARYVAVGPTFVTRRVTASPVMSSVMPIEGKLSSRGSTEYPC
jgi:hypothetical protein